MVRWEKWFKLGTNKVSENRGKALCHSPLLEDVQTTIDMGLLVASTKYHGEFKERPKKLMDEIKQSVEIILFIDEVHALIGAGATEGAIVAANILKPTLTQGKL
ncbi:hypothetical protein SUGI_0942620 [Cryptomeria japonica]|nr:hypothetical protein SUGI_0942620 [Cryptomeria japonica]